jgi:hypothetical protein
VGSLVKERWRAASALVELSVANQVANFYKKFGQFEGGWRLEAQRAAAQFF